MKQINIKFCELLEYLVNLKEFARSGGETRKEDGKEGKRERVTKRNKNNNSYNRITEGKDKGEK